MLVAAATLLAIPMFLMWTRRSWVARFDEHGVTLRNGRTFAWPDFERVVPRKMRPRSYGINHYDLVFRTGKARVFHQMATNRAQVVSIVDALGRGENPFRP
jgi:hypothetical protein